MKDLNFNTPKAVIGTNSWGGKLYEKVLRGSYVKEDIIANAVREAEQEGLFVYDTAQDYGFGKGQKLLGNVATEETIISAKYTPMRKYRPGIVFESADRDMEDFHRDYIDIYWLHLPKDMKRHLKEIAALYHEGSIKHIGVSNFNLEECKEAKMILEEEGTELYGVQNHYSLLDRSAEYDGTLSWCQENGIQFWAWAVLEEGMLVAPKRDEKMTIMKAVFQRTRKELTPLYQTMKIVGRRHNLSIAQVAIAYVANKGIVPICGCRKPYQVIELAAAVNTKFNKKEMAYIEEMAAELDAHVLKADLFRKFS